MSIPNTLYEAMYQRGMRPDPSRLMLNGKPQRFPVSTDKGGSKSGWLIGYEVYGGFIATAGDWKTGERFTIKSRPSQNLSALEQFERNTELAKKIESDRRARAQVQLEVCSQARSLVESAGPVSPANRYLIRKNIKGTSVFESNDVLLVPIVNGDLQIVNCQRIYPNGSKRFLKGGEVRGCFHLIGDFSKENLIIAEGYATGASIHEFTGSTVVCALTASNLPAVASVVRALLPDTTIMIYADNDHRAAKNVGREYGNRAAELINAGLSWPSPCSDSCTCTDFNDSINCMQGGIQYV